MHLAACVFNNNVGYSKGGGAMIMIARELLVNSCTFGENNYASATGGGLELMYVYGMITNSEFSGNFCGESGGGRRGVFKGRVFRV